jgi:hypothetical protein
MTVKSSEGRRLRRGLFVIGLSATGRLTHAAVGVGDPLDAAAASHRPGACKLTKWIGRRVTITGELGRWGSALVYPSIYIEISSIRRFGAQNK